MKAKEFVERCMNAAKLKTVYLQGGWGVRMSNDQIDYYTSTSVYPVNTKAARKRILQKVSPDTFGFDCVCFVKSILWGFTGDLSDAHGGAIYASNGIPDTTIGNLYQTYCREQSSDMNDIRAGEFLIYNGSHCAIYVGDGKIVEANLKGEIDGVVVREYLPEEWTGHGKLLWIDYTDPKVSRLVCPCCGSILIVKEGD